MKGLYRNIIAWVSVALLATACYEDKGNYDYREINDVQVELPKVSVRLPLQGETEIVVEPSLTQTQIGNEENLRFKWYVGTMSSEFICEEKDCQDNHFHFYSEEKVFRMKVSADYNQKLQLLLEVHDVVGDTKCYQKQEVKIVKPLSNTWFVLQEVGGKGQLGVADGEQDQALIAPDACQTLYHTTFPLQGKPLSIDCRHNYGPRYYQIPMGAPSVMPMMILCTNQDMQLIYPTTLKAKHGIKDMVYGAVKAGTTIWKPSYYHHANYGEVLCDQGRLWHSLMDGFAVYYSVKDDEGKAVEADKAVELDDTSYLIYDEKKHRFLSYSYGSMDGFMISFYKTQYVRGNKGSNWSDQGVKSAYPLESAGELFNPSQIDPSWKVQSMISSNNFAMAMASVGGSALKVLEFTSSTEESVAGLYELNVPDGAKVEDCKFTTSYAYSRIFFFAVGNKVYKVDLNRGTPKMSMIYEHSDASARTAALKFKEVNKDEDNPNRYEMQLGVAFNLADGSGSVVELKLNAAGDVKREEGSMYEYKGFKTIVDIAYNYGE